MFYFRCISNPKAPILKLEHYWEMQDMLKHTDYIRVDEDGLPIVNHEEEAAPNRIPIAVVKRK